MVAEPTDIKRGQPRVAIDLDANKAARREAQGEPPIVVFGGETFTLPIECPFTFIEDLDEIEQAEKSRDGGRAATATKHLVESLLGDQYEAFMRHNPTMNDLESMVTGLLPAYGFQENARGN